MFTRAERLISLRNLRPKKKEGFLKVISIFSFLGIMLGVAILIIVISVMNGFKTDLTKKILGLNPHVVIQPNSFQIDKKYISSQKKYLKTFDDLDLFNDIESCMGLLKNLDLFITVSNSTAHFAGALGIPTILICPKKSSTYYYWNTHDGSSIWYKNVKVLGIEISVSKTIEHINKIIKENNKFDFSNNKHF